MFNKKTIKDVEIAGKVVLLRADYNVPIDYSDSFSPKITSDFRIKSSLPTIKYLLEHGVKKIIIISHLGRPNSVESQSEIGELETLASGEFKFSLKPVYRNLKQLLEQELGRQIKMNFHTQPIFAQTRYSQSIAEADDDYEIEMLENLRFSKSEKKNSSDFSRALVEVSGADLFVQDGFGVIHRAHCSTDGVARILPSVAGLLLEKEVSFIDQVTKKPARPLVVVMGGAKVSDKLPLIDKFIDIADEIIVCGAMANAFLKNRQIEIGRSKVDQVDGQIISKIEKRAFDKFRGDFYNKFQLPIDVKVAHDFSPLAHDFNVGIDQILPSDYVLDIGNQTYRRASRLIAEAKTIIWNGTAGYIEFDNFKSGSAEIAAAISSATNRGATSVIGGGDTSGFVLEWQEQNADRADFSLISTGGGAALELMSGASLPGLEILPEKSTQK